MYVTLWSAGTSNLFVTNSVFLQYSESVVGSLAFAVELYSPSQAIVLHLESERLTFTP